MDRCSQLGPGDLGPSPYPWSLPSRLQSKVVGAVSNHSTPASIGWLPGEVPEVKAAYPRSHVPCRWEQVSAPGLGPQTPHRTAASRGSVFWEGLGHTDVTRKGHVY